ncbi:MAG: glycosyltransferase [Lachnospiraceae bacterium]|nr:glycosyltransferase [Lachnospiraceae bacterium]
MSPKVSILVPIYKVPERFLRRCIESTLKQTLRDIEIVLVDDGSPDQCGEICDEYASSDSRIKVIHKANAGLAAARNSAFDACIGEYITFLDGDDYLESTACEKAYETALKEDVQLLFWNQFTEYPNRTVRVTSFGSEAIKFNKTECRKLQARVLDFNGKIAQVFCKLIKRDFLIEHNIRHVETLSQGAEGFVFNIQLFEHLESAYYTPEYLLHYTYNENSISHSPDERNYYLVIRCFEYVENFIKSSDNKDELQKKLYNRMLYVVVTTGITGYFNPTNEMKYKERKKGYMKFLQEPLVSKSLNVADYKELSVQRKIILKCIQYRQFWVLQVLGKVRRIQLKI